MLSKQCLIYRDPLVSILLFTSLLRKCTLIFYLGALLSDCLTETKLLHWRLRPQGRCLFRYMPPRINEIHTFTDSVFSFECVLWGEGCVAFAFDNVIHIYLWIRDRIGTKKLYINMNTNRHHHCVENSISWLKILNSITIYFFQHLN